MIVRYSRVDGAARWDPPTANEPIRWRGGEPPPHGPGLCESRAAWWWEHVEPDPDARVRIYREGAGGGPDLAADVAVWNVAAEAVIAGAAARLIDPDPRWVVALTRAAIAHHELEPGDALAVITREIRAKLRPCACGCGRAVWSSHRRRYASGSCRVRVLRERSRGGGDV